MSFSYNPSVQQAFQLERLPFVGIAFHIDGGWFVRGVGDSMDQSREADEAQVEPRCKRGGRASEME